VHPRIAALTVQHLLTMSTGHDADTLTAIRDVPAERWLSSLLAVVPQTPVGSRHVYNNGASLLLAHLIQRVSGVHLLDYLRPRLLEPLGISDATWSTDGLGRELGWSGLHVRTEDLAALGQLLLDDGVWRGERLLPEGWVKAAGSAQIGTADEEGDWSLGYGYQMWISSHGFRADGAYGQFCLVLPEHDAVVVTTSGQTLTQVILAHVWTHLLPAMSGAALPSDPAAERALSDRLATLVQAPLPAAIAPGVEDAPPWLPALSELALVRSGSSWTLTMLDAGQPLAISCGDGRWVDSTLTHPAGAEIPISARAGANGPGWYAEIVFVETPHRLRIELPGAASEAPAVVRWNVTPLDITSLAELHA